MGTSTSRDVTFSIKESTNNQYIEEPVRYEIKKIGVDKSTNIFFKIYDPEYRSIKYLSFQKKDTRNFVDILKALVSPEEGVVVINDMDLDWFNIFQPSLDGKIERQLWFCNLIKASSSVSKISLVFDWTYYGYEKDVLLPIIKEFSEGEEMKLLRSALSKAKRTHDQNPMGGMKYALKQLSLQYGGVVDLSDFQCDTLDLAKKTIGYDHDFGDYLMKQHKGNPYYIILELDVDLVKEIIEELEKLG